MTVFNKIEAEDSSGSVTTVTNFNKLKFNNSLKRDAGRFQFTVKNTGGENKSTFNISDDITIYTDRNNPSTTPQFVGFIEDLDFQSEGSAKETITVRGRQLIQLLHDVTIINSYDGKEDIYIVIDMLDEKVTNSQNIDDMEDATNWDNSADDATVAVTSTAFFTEGTKSILMNVDVTKSGSTVATWTNSTDNHNLDEMWASGVSGKFGMQIDVDDATGLATSDNWNVRIGSSASDYIGWNVTLVTNRNNILLDVANTDESAGSVDWENVDYIRFRATEAATPQDVNIYVDNLRAFKKNSITYQNIDLNAAVTVDHITFNRKTVRECIKQLQGTSKDLWIDVNKDLHYVLEGATTSGITLDSNTIIRGQFIKTRREMWNSVLVYGDRYLVGTFETFAADGGSTFTLNNKPHNTLVTVGSPANIDNTLQQGAIFETTAEATSGTDYLVNYDQRELTFVSGTETGDQIPTSGTDFVYVKYDFNKLIVKETDNPSSRESFKTREKFIVDRSVKDPRHAKDIAKDFINEFGEPQEQGRMFLSTLDQSFFSLNIGELIKVNIPDQNVNNQEFKIEEVRYTMGTNRERSETHMEVRVATVVRDLSDIIGDALTEINQLKAAPVETGIISPFKSFTGSAGMRSSWYVRTRDPGSSFIFGNDGPNNFLGTWGSGLKISGGVISGTIQPFWGDSRGTPVIQVSGGTF